MHVGPKHWQETCDAIVSEDSRGTRRADFRPIKVLQIDYIVCAGIKRSAEYFVSFKVITEINCLKK